ncbi:hypothetical protein [Phormidium nigroviride]|nr:hypothetical protein [Oscillatoria nigro-viridis]
MKNTKTPASFKASWGVVSMYYKIGIYQPRFLSGLANLQVPQFVEIFLLLIIVQDVDRKY